VKRLATTGLLLGCVLALPSAGQYQPSRARITGIAHIAVYASDVAKARIFYKDVLGLAEVVDSGLPTGSAVFRIGERQFVEVRPEPATATDRLDHVALETDDAAMLLRGLKQRGLAVPAEVTKTPAGDLSFKMEDPDGHSLVFILYLPAGLQARARGTPVAAAAISASLRHVGVLVGALEPSLAFYRTNFAFSETWRGSRDGQVLNWVNLKVPDGEDYLELMLYKDLPAPTERGTAHHLCLFVSDIEAAKAAVAVRTAKAGYTRPLEIRTGVNRKRQMNLYDPDGTRAELMEPHTIDGVPTPSATAAPPRK
jgi:catechol 2,3-dioxygenase-like lactoylglutathione lyase family enzyme